MRFQAIVMGFLCFFLHFQHLSCRSRESELRFRRKSYIEEAKYQVSKAKIFSSLFDCAPHQLISLKEIQALL